MQHAVPLNESAVARLAHSAMALDVYTWLAQRLHRVDPQKLALVPWVSLKEQFGIDYGRMVDFRGVFTRTVAQVKAVYRDARFTVDEKGIRLSEQSSCNCSAHPDRVVESREFDSAGFSHTPCGIAWILASTYARALCHTNL